MSFTVQGFCWCITKCAATVPTVSLYSGEDCISYRFNLRSR